MALLTRRSSLLIRSAHPLTFWAQPLHVAVIGSGPAGFYVTQHLLKRPDARIVIFEKWPVPFGLVRSGVAPDHPEVKNVVNSFSKTASSPRVSFLGNVSIGTDLTLHELRQLFHVVVLCYGSAKDRTLSIPGEDERNVISARRFVGWYNGAPEDQDLDLDLGVDSCLIIGQGNVALDCARILATPESILRNTDITKHSLKALSQSDIRQIRLMGRRGPLQVAFTIKEFRELSKIHNCRTIIRPQDLSFLTPEVLEKLPRPRKRLTQLMQSISQSEETAALKECHFDFHRIPVSITRTATNRLRVEFAISRLEDPTSEETKVHMTDKRETIETGLVIKSIGYTTVALDPSIEIDDRRGCIRNEGGKIPGLGPGLYCSGWAATGATGVLLGTMNTSFEVAKNILRDVDEGEIVLQDDRKGGQQVTQLLKQRNVQFVTFDDWSRIDEVEREKGKKEGKPREKIVSVEQMVEAAMCTKVPQK